MLSEIDALERFAYDEEILRLRSWFECFDMLEGVCLDMFERLVWICLRGWFRYA